MTNKVLIYLAAIITGVVVLCAGGLTAIETATATAQCTAAPLIPSASHTRPLHPPATFTAIRSPHATWSRGQVADAATIAAVGADADVPPRGWVIAIATAMQESALRNLGNLGSDNDHDSLGLFQQRPSQGWGTPSEIMDPTHAATRFYAKLLTVTDWQILPLTRAAQAVQRSAYPDAYAKWETDAEQLVTAVGSWNLRTIPEDREQCPVTCPGSVNTVEHSSPRPECLPDVGVLARAATWLTAWGRGPVPYLSSADPASWFDGYRRDCSGYVSMALGLPGPGLTAAGLAARSTPIEKGELRAGDLLINPAPGGAGHVVIFERWTDSTMSSYVGYEQSGDGGTHHRVIPYFYFGGYLLSPFRFQK